MGLFTGRAGKISPDGEMRDFIVMGGKEGKVSPDLFKDRGIMAENADPFAINA